jgi:hypothetical protein
MQEWKGETMLEIVNSYGNVDVRNGVPKGYEHIGGKRLQPLCRKLGIEFVRALVNIEQSGPYRRRILDGVVVPADSAAKLIEAINARNNTPAAKARKQQKERERKELLRKEQQRIDRCEKLGIHPGGRTAELLQDGDIDDGLAELIGFKCKYRHEHSDYDQHFDESEFHDLRSIGLSPQEAKKEMRATARMSKEEDPIPETWPEYLEKYGFDSPVATALPSVLKSARECYPIWFKEAEIAVRRAGLPLDSLNYSAIKQAVDKWRCERGVKKRPSKPIITEEQLEAQIEGQIRAEEKISKIVEISDEMGLPQVRTKGSRSRHTVRKLAQEVRARGIEATDGQIWAAARKVPRKPSKGRNC